MHVPVTQCILDHGSFEVAQGPRRDLFYRSLAAGEANSVVLGRQIADQRGNPVLRLKQGQCFLEEGRLP
jgi:hypothetical protein